MQIFGVSQTSGADRRVFVERGGEGVVLVIKVHGGGKELARVLVPADELLAAITDPAPGGSTVEGTSPAHGWQVLLGVEVRRNEVWLSAKPAAGAGADAAVGLDDFQDALAGAIGQD
jgi:hypothetical protein